MTQTQEIAAAPARPPFPNMIPAAPGGSWQERLAQVVDTMREISRQTDPQAMVRTYAARAAGLTGFDGMVSVSRRNLSAPWYRITRSSRWETPVDPWRQAAKLPTFDRGILGQWVYGEEPQLINDLVVSPDDPAAEYFDGMRSAIAVPHFDGGQALNMVVHMKREPHAFAPDDFPQIVWMSSLFGRATQNLVLSGQLRDAYAAVDRELQVVADIQRSLLPTELPTIPTLDLAAHYQTSRYAGGDYYDFFELPHGRWGILIADVSGHGTPAAVIMAILHSIAHAVPGQPDSPAATLRFLNKRLTCQYTGGRGTFVTAFYGVYDPATRTLRYARAGHNSPRLKRCADDSINSLDRADGLPLGIETDAEFTEHVERLSPGDVLLFYTDGITEAWSPAGDMFGLDRLDAILGRCLATAQGTVDEILQEVDAFSAGLAATDDRTLLAAQVE